MITDVQLKNMASAQMEWAVSVRRQLHRVPETGFQEHKTRKIIVERLQEIGIEYKEENDWTV